ncbi:MAG: metallophosphoesterase family protein [Bacillota bacterium]
MNLALLGDIHGNLPALERVLKEIEKEKAVDGIFCTGDIVGYGPQPNEVVELIKSNGIKTVMGNHDEAVGYNLPMCGCNYPSDRARAAGEKSLAWTKERITKDNRQFLRNLPEELSIVLPDGSSALVFHGSPRAINEYITYNLEDEILDELIMYSDARVLIFGHTHIPFVRTYKGRLLINTGSVGQPKDGDNRACFILADFSPNGVTIKNRRVEYDINQVVSHMLDLGLPDEHIETLRSGRLF